jgi:hypothetical protein
MDAIEDVGASDLAKTISSEGADVDALVHLEIEIEDQVEPRQLALPGGDSFLAALRECIAVDAEIHIFERDGDEPLLCLPRGRSTLRLVAHRHHHITVQVRYEHLIKDRTFTPAKTVFNVLQWAVGKHGFDLDPVSAAKANLILPGASTPLPRDAAIGKYIEPHTCILVVDLTLKDFTNGWG